MISRQAHYGLKALASRSVARLSVSAIATRSYSSPSSSSTRRRLEEQEQLRNAYKLDILGNGDEEEEVARRKKKRTYEPNPEVPNLEKLATRWPKMDTLDQDEISIYLEDRMRGDWRKMSDLEKKSALYVSFGPWGPRDPDGDRTGNGYGIFIKSIAISMALITGIQVYNKKMGFLNSVLPDEESS